MTSRPVARARRTVVLILMGTAVGCASDSAPEHHRVDIRELAFVPADLAVQAGDTVTWTNRDVVPHTVTVSDGTVDSPRLDPGDTFTLVVPPGGARPYTCRYHPGMAATLTPGR